VFNALFHHDGSTRPCAVSATANRFVACLPGSLVSKRIFDIIEWRYRGGNLAILGSFAPRQEDTMSLELPSLVAAYIQAQNAHDADSMLLLFAEEAVVHDEGQEHQGIVAIRRWFTATSEKYRVSLQPLSVVEEGAETILTAQVTGNFPGSPTPLRFRFTLTGDKIAALAIHP
jgi:ketosteroid isomerase-like protein